MLIVLPPSETKRDGGVEGSALDLRALRYPSLTAPRRTALAALRKLSSSVATASEALGLSAAQRFEVQRNRAVRSSPVLPAIERYTGVLYDALDAPTLAPDAREFAAAHLVIHSALFGLVGAADPIPAYRLSHDSKLPTSSVRALWAIPVARELAAYDGLVLDLRSESYTRLGPAPGAAFVRVVAADGRALNHFNKQGKGRLARALLAAGIAHPDADSLVGWAQGVGVPLRHGPAGLELVADDPRR